MARCNWWARQTTAFGDALRAIIARFLLPAPTIPRELNELAAGIFAYNEALSQSGWAAPITHLAEMGLAPSRLLETGGHALSAHAVGEGRADFASLDALTWELLREHSDLGTRLRHVASTNPTPALPYSHRKRTGRAPNPSGCARGH